MKRKFRIKSLTILFTFLAIAFVTVGLIGTHSSASSSKTVNIDNTDSEPAPINISNAIIKQAAKEKAEKLREEEKNYKIYLIEVLLDRYNSPMRGLGKLMYERTTECGGDYKIVVAIAGNESGFGRISYKLYNPFGYLDGVQYDSFEHAVDVISCKIAERFLKPCNNDLTCVIRTYGGHDTNREQWIANISYFMKLL